VLQPLLTSTLRRKRLEACLYTMAPGEDFILDRLDRVVVASCCSGHGFKMGPAVGSLGADLVAGKPPHSRFALSRFQGAQPAAAT
jgi:sarcosine oxidase